MYLIYEGDQVTSFKDKTQEEFSENYKKFIQRCQLFFWEG